LDHHLYAFDATQQDVRAAEIPKSQHGSRAALDRAMVLLDEVIQIF